jgi:hypothetical protein
MEPDVGPDNMFPPFKESINMLCSALSSENPLTSTSKSGIIKEGQTIDGGPGSGIKGHRTPKKETVKATPAQKSQYDKTLIGAKTAAGVPVSSIRDHAYDRAIERGATPEEIANALAEPEISLPADKKKGNAPTFQSGKVKVAFDPKIGQIRTIMKGEEW